jgi:hypothetical protein
VEAAQDIAKIRELTNAIHTNVQAARVTGEPADVLKLLVQVSDALLHVIGAHSYAEAALRAGARLDVVSRALGRSNAAVTGNVCLHDNDAGAFEAADLLGAATGEYRGNDAGIGTGP